MSKLNSTLALALSLAIGATLAQSASAACPATTPTFIYGNGGSFSATALRRLFDSFGNTINSTTCSPAAPLANPFPATGYPNPVNLFGPVNPLYQFWYASTGSGAGQANFLNNNFAAGVASSSPVFAGNADNVVPFTPLGYPYTTGTAPGSVPPDFNNSDAPFSSAQLNSYGSVKGNDYVSSTRGTLSQLPFTAGPVGLAYNLPALTTTLKLTRAEYCGIWNGTLTSWGQIAATASVYPNLPITVARRSDSSGTTDIFTKHLFAVCSGYPSTLVGEGPFDFPPTNEVSASGNTGVRDAVAANGAFLGQQAEGRIGYLTATAFVPVDVATPVYNNSGVSYRSGLPAAALQNQASITAGGNPKYYLPTPAGVTAVYTGSSTSLPSNPGPNSFANIQATYGVNPPAKKAYPIVGLTYLLVQGSKGFGNNRVAQATGVKAAICWILAPTGTAPTQADQILNASGFGPLDDQLKAKVRKELGRNLLAGTNDCP